MACSLRVNNTGTTNLTDIQTAVNNVGATQAATHTSCAASLAVGTSSLCQATYNLLPEDLAGSSISLAANANAAEVNGTEVTPRAVKLGVLQVTGAVDITDAATPGTNVSAIVTIVNAGPINITGITVTPPTGLVFSNGGCSVLSLIASDGTTNGSVTCTTTYAVTAADAKGSNVQKSLGFVVTVADSAKLSSPVSNPLLVNIPLAAFTTGFTAANCSTLTPGVNASKSPLPASVTPGLLLLMLVTAGQCSYVLYLARLCLAGWYGPWQLDCSFTVAATRTVTDFLGKFGRASDLQNATCGDPSAEGVRTCNITLDLLLTEAEITQKNINLTSAATSTTVGMFSAVTSTVGFKLGVLDVSVVEGSRTPGTLPINITLSNLGPVPLTASVVLPANMSWVAGSPCASAQGVVIDYSGTVGALQVCAAVYNVTSAMRAAHSVDLPIAVRADGLNAPVTITHSADLRYAALAVTPSLGGQINKANDTVVYNVEVVNTGNVLLTDVAINTNLSDTLASSALEYNTTALADGLDAGERLVFVRNFTYTTNADIRKSNVTVTVSITGVGADRNRTWQATTTIVPNRCRSNDTIRKCLTWLPAVGQYCFLVCTACHWHARTQRTACAD